MKRTLFLWLFVALSSVSLAGCGRARQAEEKAAPSAEQGAVQKPAAPAVPEKSPRYVTISVYVTDSRNNRGVSDAEVMIGQEQLLPTPLPSEYGEDPVGLYATDNLDGGSYLFRVRREGYRSFAGRLEVPPPPERIVGGDPPVVLEPEGGVESPEKAPSVRVLVLWQKHVRRTPGQAPPHPPIVKPSGVSPHTVVTHPVGSAPGSPASPP